MHIKFIWSLQDFGGGSDVSYLSEEDEESEKNLHSLTL